MSQSRLVLAQVHHALSALLTILSVLVALCSRPAAAVSVLWARLSAPARPQSPVAAAQNSISPALRLALLGLLAAACPVSAQLPITSGLYQWYNAGASTAAADIVVDRSGNGRTGSVLSSSGLARATDAAGTNGVSPTCATGPTYVSGTTSTQVWSQGESCPLSLHFPRRHPRAATATVCRTR